MAPAPKRPVRPAERAARLRSSQRKHKDKVKHRIIDLESRLLATERGLERALSAISALSDGLRAVAEQNKRLQPQQRCSSESLTSNPSSSRAAQLSEAASRRQEEHVRKLTLPWENDANPEDFSWSSAFLEGVNIGERRDTGPAASSSSAVGGDGCADESTPGTCEDGSLDTHATAASEEGPAEELPHESYDGVDIAAMRDWIDPRFEKAYGAPDGGRIQPPSLFALMDFISS
ncbi:hypothetical protein H634G_10552 [Metarhizium anisopliae BRIP 53293]|uniref:BZIP domain-containing protein n=1 Tax=Metarhizium anisopliae BRIP 53293 TaxID=1291518 RepID=A0A0D9NJQ3_METAN|nr:hypothetical protein H634G_10552 [Metarhizium anisopliae BRIP 53293]KJK90015.1 hypothetical protein H633G_06130 [Metarhizium anisopliae BRIP 53284]